MILAAGTLAAYLSTCAPSVAPSTMTAIVGVESGGDPLALHDNTTRRAYSPRDARTALAIADTLIRRGHSVDVGVGQVNSANFASYRVDAARMLDPCANLEVASRILEGDYAHAVAIFPQPREALWHAISAYNTGSLFAGRAYVEAVVAAATRPPRVPPIALLTANAAMPAPMLPPVPTGAGAAVEPPILPPVSKGTLAIVPSRAKRPAPRAPARPPASFGMLREAGIPHTLSIAINEHRGQP